MADTSVLEYKCPCCNAGLKFGYDVQKMTCEYCDNTFALESVMAYNEQETDDDFQWQQETPASYTEADTQLLQAFSCPACGGEMVTDEQTVATFCPFCGNPAVLPGRVSGGMKPDAVIPFQTGKEDAQKAFRALCKGKLLLPKGYADDQQLEKITGIYVPFWLYSCSGDQQGRYRGIRVHHWSDSRYHYTKKDYFQLNRSAKADFVSIPMDGSAKMEDDLMESIEPYDYSRMVDFDTAYLSGYFADKYDVASDSGEERIRQRVASTLDDRINASCIGYVSVTPISKRLQVKQSCAKYVLMPVWILRSRYKDQLYTFAMNGQTGKMTGSFPICPKRSAAWFAGICAAVTALVSVIQWLVL